MCACVCGVCGCVCIFKIVYANTEMVLERVVANIEREKALGPEVIMTKAILDNSDGCAVQY